MVFLRRQDAQIVDLGLKLHFLLLYFGETVSCACGRTPFFISLNLLGFHPSACLAPFSSSSLMEKYPAPTLMSFYEKKD